MATCLKFREKSENMKKDKEKSLKISWKNHYQGKYMYHGNSPNQGEWISPQRSFHVSLFIQFAVISYLFLAYTVFEY